jgi:hypothetical protein
MSDLSEALNRALEAQRQYYKGVGKLTVDYWRGLLDIFVSATKGATAAGGQSASTGAAAAAAAAAAPAPASVSLVLEAESGDAVGVFLVDNKLPRTVSAPVVVSDFVGPDGRTVRPVVTISPATVTLSPGAQQVVQLSVGITQELSPDVVYRAQVAVPGLSDGKISLILRRRAAAATPSS